MRRTIILFLAAVTLACLLSGCDFLRKVASRPTSVELETLKADRTEKERVLADSLAALKAAEEYEAAETAARDRFNGAGVTFREENGVEGLQCRYCIVLGSFLQNYNAGRIASEVEGCGLQPVKFRYVGGYTSVGVCSDTLAVLWKNYSRLESEPFFPQDAWIMINADR
ncbi:MAG: hypothetical protein MJY45_02165 [Bacteroidales bacterium]|nr:hypothetical protein [Bacteroidales bacterium]